jgi:hypothetical protein
MAQGRDEAGDFPRPPSTDEWHLLKAQVAESTRAREKYIPVIERMDERMDALHDTIGHLNSTIGKLVDRMSPMITEREMVIKSLRFVSGIVVGVLASVATWYVIEWLKTTQ